MSQSTPPRKTTKSPILITSNSATIKKKRTIISHMPNHPTVATVLNPTMPSLPVLNSLMLKSPTLPQLNSHTLSLLNRNTLLLPNSNTLLNRLTMLLLNSPTLPLLNSNTLPLLNSPTLLLLNRLMQLNQHQVFLPPLLALLVQILAVDKMPGAVMLGATRHLLLKPSQQPRHP